MKRLGFLLTASLFAVTTLTMAQSYSFVGSFATAGGNQTPGALGQGEQGAGVVLKSDGTLYYVTFQAATSQLVYVTNAVGAALGESYTTTSLSTESLPTGRGLNDIDMDSAGNIYFSGTGNDAATTVLKKFNAAPAHTQAWTSVDTRINGIEVVNDNNLAFNVAFTQGINYKNTSDGVTNGTAVTGGTNYCRSLSLNTSNNDLYVGRNGNSVAFGLKIFSGGSPTNLAGYTTVTDNLLDTLAVNSATAVATQATEYDPEYNQLLIADFANTASSDFNAGLRVYNISGSGASTNFTEAQYIQGRGGPTNLYNNVTGISVARITRNNQTRNYIALCVQVDQDGDLNPTSATDRFFAIDIWQHSTTEVEDWQLFN